MSEPLRSLILEDNPNDVLLLVHELQRAGYALEWRTVSDEAGFTGALDWQPDVVLADYSLPGFDALRALEILHECGLDVPVVIVTGAIGEEAAVECLRRGAADYVLKDRTARLGAAVAGALEQRRLRSEARRAEEQLREALAQLQAAHDELEARVQQRTAELVEREQTLANLQARWAATVESMLDPVTVCDAEGRAVYMNAAYSRLVGRTIGSGLARQEHPHYYQIYRTDGTLFAPDELPLQQAALYDRSVANVEIVQLSSDGDERRLIFSASPMHDGEGKVMGAVAVGHDVTELRRAERERAELLAKVEEQREVLDAFLVGIADGIIIYDQAGRIVRINQTAQRLLALPQELHDTGFAERIAFTQPLHADGSPVRPEEIPGARALCGETVQGEVMVLPRAAGRAVWLSTSSAPVRARDGRLLGAITSLSDITGLHQVQQELEQASGALEAHAEQLRVQNDELARAAARLREERALLQAVLHQMPGGVIIAEAPSGEVVLANQQMEEILRGPYQGAGVPFEYLPYPCYRSDGSAYRPGDAPLARTMLSGEPVQDEEIHFTRPDGSIAVMLSSSAPVRNERGQVVAGVATFYDITERKDLEDAHREQSLLLNALLENLPVVVMRCTEDGTFTESRGTGLRSIGLRDGQAVGSNVLTGYPKVEQPLRQAIEGGKVHFLSSVDTEQGPVYFENWLFFDEARGRGVVGFAIDVTQRQQMEFELRQARDELEGKVAERTAELAGANRALQESGEQLRRLSSRLVEVQEDERRAIARELHDEVGQALTSLMVGLGLLERQATWPAQAVERIEDLKDVAGQVLEDIHRIGADLRPASLDRSGLVPALRQYVDQYRRQHEVTVQFEASDLDGSRLPPQVETTLYRIVQESLTNVARHANATRVGIALTRHGDRVSAIIEDNGVGFDPVEAAHRGRLGLVGMRERAEMLKGEVTIESSPGDGTTVFVEVPCDGHN